MDKTGELRLAVCAELECTLREQRDELLAVCEAAGEWAAAYPIGGIDDAIIAEDILRQCNAAIAKAKGA